MPKTTRTQSLYEQAVAAENLRHASRLKELRAGEKKLALLDSIAGQLEAAGIALYPGDLQMGRNHIYVAAGWGDQRIAKLAAWLVADGFKETYRQDYSSFSAVRFSKGRLHIQLHLTAKQVAP